MAVMLYCGHCGKPRTARGELPVVCPECKRDTKWETTAPLKLTVKDKDYLRSIRVSPE